MGHTEEDDEARWVREEIEEKFGGSWIMHGRNRFAVSCPIYGSTQSAKDSSTSGSSATRAT